MDLIQRKRLCVCVFVVAGVLEMETEQDRDAIRKAKVLYSSCMNESKALFVQSQPRDPITSLRRRGNIRHADRNTL